MCGFGIGTIFQVAIFVIVVLVVLALLRILLGDWIAGIASAPYWNVIQIVIGGVVAILILLFLWRLAGVRRSVRPSWFGVSGVGMSVVGIVLVVILILVLFGGIAPGTPWGYGYGVGHYGVGGIGLVLVILLVLVLLGENSMKLLRGKTFTPCRNLCQAVRAEALAQGGERSVA